MHAKLNSVHEEGISRQRNLSEDAVKLLISETLTLTRIPNLFFKFYFILLHSTALHFTYFIERCLDYSKFIDIFPNSTLILTLPADSKLLPCPRYLRIAAMGPT